LPGPKLDLHTHYYPQVYFDKIRELPSEFAFDKSPSGQTIIKYRWIVGHLGGAVPYLMERMDNGWRDFPECREKIDELPSVYLRRLYYDTVNFNPHMLNMAREMFGADHMVMGSDYPHLLGSIDRAVSSIENLDIPEEEKQRIFAGTALAILNNL